MKKLSVSQEKERDRLVTALRKASEELEKAVDVMNEVIESQRQRIAEIQERYNDLVAEANEFREEVETQIQEYYDEKTEKWQESDAGRYHADWARNWSDDLLESDLSLPEDASVDGLSAADDLEQLPDGP